MGQVHMNDVVGNTAWNLGQTWEGRERVILSTYMSWQHVTPNRFVVIVRSDVLYDTGPSWYLLEKYWFTICAAQLWQGVEMIKCVCDCQERVKLLVSDSTTLVPWERKVENVRLPKAVLGFNVRAR